MDLESTVGSVPSSSDGIYSLADAGLLTAGSASAQSVPNGGMTAATSEMAATGNTIVSEDAHPLARSASSGPAPVSASPADALPKAETSATAQPTAPPKDAEKDRGPKLRGRRKQPKHRFDARAWVVSAVVHLGLLFTLGAITLAPQAALVLKDLNTALIATTGSTEELTNIYADPSNAPRDQAVGDMTATTAGPGSGMAMAGIGSGAPSATPRVGVGTSIGERNSLPSVKVLPQVSGLSMLPAAPSRDLGGGGLIAGDVTYEAGDIGVALDQVAREILRHLADHKLTVVWLFDESSSMKDDQKAVKSKFDRIANELRQNIDPSKKAAGALNYVVVGFGEGIHFEVEKPTADVDVVAKAIDRLRVDDSGIENTMHAVGAVIEKYGRLVTKDRRLLIVLVTDESGDDGASVEEARQAAVSKSVPIYVIGRQSLFGYDRAHLRYVDPVTKDVYWPTIKRGPETADVELVQWDGLHERWDEQPSGFAPYELARLAKATGGIYFLLPSEENMRVRTREQAYSIKTMKEYVPDYESRITYAENRNKSEFRRNLYEIIQVTKGFPFRRHFPIEPAAMLEAINAEYPIVTLRLNILIDIEKRLKAMAKLRDREPEKRWQAHYDLMLAEIMTYQIKAYEYRACLEEMAKNPPKPKTMPNPSLVVEWVLDHSQDRKAPKEKTEKVYAEAITLLKKVIERHPKTPWADLAQDELNRGLGVQRNEWHHNPQYGERAKLVPKY